MSLNISIILSERVVSVICLRDKEKIFAEREETDHHECIDFVVSDKLKV